MSLSKLSGDEQGIILDQLRNKLDPRLVMYFSSANKELRALLTPAMREQLIADYREAMVLCHKEGKQSWKELREAKKVEWWCMNLSPADLTTLAALGSVLPALQELTLCGYGITASRQHTCAILGGGGVKCWGRSARQGDYVQRFADGLVAGGSLPALLCFEVASLRVGNAAASALAAALDRGALPRLQSFKLFEAAIGDAGLAALAPALRRRPLTALHLNHVRLDNAFGDAGLTALLAPPPPAGTLPLLAGGLKSALRRCTLQACRPQRRGAEECTPSLPAGGLKKLKELHLYSTKVTDAGCAALAAALDSGALPALEHVYLCTGSSAATKAVHQALARSRAAATASESDAVPTAEPERSDEAPGPAAEPERGDEVPVARGILETTDANTREIVEIQREFKDEQIAAIAAARKRNVAALQELAQLKNMMFRMNLVLLVVLIILTVMVRIYL